MPKSTMNLCRQRPEWLNFAARIGTRFLTYLQCAFNLQLSHSPGSGCFLCFDDHTEQAAEHRGMKI